MPSSSKNWHHLNLRKRFYQNLEQYPSSDQFKNVLDKLVVLAGVFGPIMTIPQILKIWVEQEVA